jgi:hypothetical protein
MLTLKIIHRWKLQTLPVLRWNRLPVNTFNSRAVTPQQIGCCTSFSYTNHVITFSFSIASIVIIVFFLLYSFLNLSVPIKNYFSQKFCSGQLKKNAMLRQKKFALRNHDLMAKMANLDARAV